MSLLLGIGVSSPHFQMCGTSRAAECCEEVESGEEHLQKMIDFDRGKWCIFMHCF